MGDDFLNQHWSVEVCCHRKAWVYLFSPNDNIVNVRSFQSFALITKASHGNDFLSLNLQTYRHRYISIKETNDNFNKVMGDDFLNQHWSVEVCCHRKAWVYLFSPNDNIVNVRSFQSFALITKASHGNDFLSLNLQTYRHRYISIKETNDNFNKCIKHKRSQQSHSSITTEIKKNGLSSLSLFRQHFQSFLGSLTPWKVYLCDAQPSEYSSHLVSYN